MRPSRFLPRITLGFLLLSCALCRAAACDTEQDRIVWARERMHPNATADQLQLVYQWLVNGTRSCIESGDLWYYRGIVANRIHDTADAAYSFRKAQEYGSQAQTRHFDPFIVVSRPALVNPNVVRDKWALIVGVTTFANSDDFLEFSGRDAKELSQFLVQSCSFPRENVKLLLDKEATTAKIREAFGEIRAKAKPDDLVLISISSHGQPRNLDPTGLSYVLTYDTDTSTQAKVFATALQMVELAELGRWVLARDYVLLLDTCFSGGAQADVAGPIVPPGSNGLDPLQGLQGSGNRIVLAASRADERSWEDPQSKHGYFTRFLLEALRQNQRQPLSSVYGYVSEHVSSAVSGQAGREQHPVMQNFGAGKDIVLGTPLTTAFVPLNGAAHGPAYSAQ